MKEEFKPAPCPFCGGDDELPPEMRQFTEDDVSLTWYYVYCPGCRSTGPRRLKETWAWQSWGYRYAESELANKLLQAAKALETLRLAINELSKALRPPGGA